MKRGLLAAAGVGAILIATPALAANNEEKGQSSVTFEDLDLSTDAGRKELEQRIKLAARKSCGVGRHSTGTRAVSREQRRCIASAEREAKRALAPVIEEQRQGG